MIAKLAVDAQKNLNMIHNLNLTFTIHEASGEIMVTVSDESTGEVIREISTFEVLNLTAKLDEIRGIVFDQKS